MPIDQTAMPEPASVVEMFNRRMTACPTEPFLLDPSGSTLTYTELSAAMHRVNDQLADTGIASGVVVGTYFLNRPEWVVTSLAAWSQGLVVAAINRLMPQQTASELLRLSKARTVCVVPDAALKDLPVRTVTVSLPDTVRSQANPWPVPGPRDDASIFFSSGTTGEPKGFLSTHEHLVNAARNQARNYSKHVGFRDTSAPPRVAPIVSFTAFGHRAAYDSLAFALWTGRRLVLVPKFTVEVVQWLVERYELTALRINPAAIYMLATTPLKLDLGPMRYVYSGTAPLPMTTRELFTKRYGVPILQGYGQSETGPVTLSRYEDVVSGREPVGSVGHVLDRVAIRIADSEGNPVPTGAEGEIQVKSPDVVAPAMGSSLPETADGFVCTGDVGKLDDGGYLWLTGRLSDKMVVGGFNVFPAEIEEVLRRHASVEDAVIVAVPDERLGEKPVAGVVWRDSPQDELLAAHAHAHLPAYKVHRGWFVLDAVPLTDRGKVNRREALARVLLSVDQ